MSTPEIRVLCMLDKMYIVIHNYIYNYSISYNIMYMEYYNNTHK